MLFTPQQFDTIGEIKDAFVFAGAHSDTTLNGKPVFGFVGNTAFEAVEEFCEVAQDWFWVAGEEI